MTDIFFLFLVIVTVIVVGLFFVKLYREIFFFEGIRLGGGFNRWLYNRWSTNYDRDKRKIQQDDGLILVAPLIGLMSKNGLLSSEAIVLDVGTGTGRFPAALLENDTFRGKVVGIDISPGMLKNASDKLGGFGNRVALLNCPAMPLPFPDNSIEVLSCLETIELLSGDVAHFQEFFRVLMPGGILMISRNTGEWGINGAVCPPDEFIRRLSIAGFTGTTLKPWWRWFDIVWAFKPGT